MGNHFKPGDIVTPIESSISYDLEVVGENPSYPNEVIVTNGRNYSTYRKSDLRLVGTEEEEMQRSLRMFSEAFDYAV